MWNTPPSDWRISKDVIDVWRCPLPRAPGVVEQCLSLLDDDERGRADRFRIESKRNEYVLVRGFLRRILGRALGRDPAGVRLCYGSQGKPFLADGAASFNVSHTRGMAMIVVTAGRRVGVDIEHVGRDIDHDRLASRYFSPLEVRMLRDLPASRREAGFFAVWTRKEALLKACGKGIMLGLDSFDVSVDPDKPARLLDVRWGGQRETWFVDDVAVGRDYAAAVAGEGQSLPLAMWEC